MTTLTIIPARLASTRLPNKPLADVCGKPMVIHVAEQALQANLGPVIIASGDAAISQVARAHGLVVFDTAPDLPSGTDRAFAALAQFDPEGQFDHIINLQGDLPTIPPSYLTLLGNLLNTPYFDMVTLACPIEDEAERISPHVVKAVLSLDHESASVGEGVYFTRSPLASSNSLFYHHIGVYGFHRNSLNRFVSLPPSPLEVFERLEQLRFLENGMRVGVGLVDKSPQGIDTKEDLERLRALLHTVKDSIAQ